MPTASWKSGQRARMLALTRLRHASNCMPAWLTSITRSCSRSTAWRASTTFLCAICRTTWTMS
eukprot:6629567-Alexandrium_andersonii.AAC.1